MLLCNPTKLFVPSLSLFVLFAALMSTSIAKQQQSASSASEEQEVNSRTFSLNGRKLGHGVRRPNVIIFLADDTGYGDFQSFGHPTQEWGGIDRMVEEGMKFTQWYSPSSACSPSRLATLTGALQACDGRCRQWRTFHSGSIFAGKEHGRYPVRGGFFVPDQDTTAPTVPVAPVLLQTSTEGIYRNETTIAEKVKEFGYTTGMVGKWHLGINRFNNTDGFHLPANHGFDYVGTNLPFTTLSFCNPDVFTLEERIPFCFLYDGSEIVQQPIELTTLTDKMVKDTKKFLKRNKRKEFFFYFSFAQTHRPMFCAPRFCGQSKRGEYGDNVNEMASAVSDILDYLKHLKIDRDTLVLFVSDNGGIVDLCPFGGNNGPFRGSKGTTLEGGIRVPAVAWWPRTIPAGTVSRSVISSMDLFPTITNLIKGEDDPSEYAGVDGAPINDILQHARSYEVPDEDNEEPRILYNYCDQDIHSVRYGDYKIHYKTKGLPPDEPPEDCNRPSLPFLINLASCDTLITEHDPPLMYNLSGDPEEILSLDSSTPENQAILGTVSQLIDDHKATIVPVPSLLLSVDPSLVPCCDPPACTCNYTP